MLSINGPHDKLGAAYTLAFECIKASQGLPDGVAADTDATADMATPAPPTPPTPLPQPTLAPTSKAAPPQPGQWYGDQWSFPPPPPLLLCPPPQPQPAQWYGDQWPTQMWYPRPEPTQMWYHRSEPLAGLIQQAEMHLVGFLHHHSKHYFIVLCVGWGIWFGVGLLLCVLSFLFPIPLVVNARRLRPTRHTAIHFTSHHLAYLASPL